MIVGGGALWMVVEVFGFYSTFSEANKIFLSRGVV